MRRIGVFLLLMMFGISISAQTQQGIVKTRGRMVNGKLVPGIRLSGATITLNFGNPLVSSNQGTFSFVVPPAKSFSLVNATKQGYTLADPEYTCRSFSYSEKDPFYVVLEDESQSWANINLARYNFQNTMMTQLKKKEKELEELKQKKKIDDQEYERKIMELNEAQDKSYELIKKIADRYASTDYDQLDERNRQIQMYIEKGELQRADSMILAKGAIEERSKELDNIFCMLGKEKKDLQSHRTAIMAIEKLVYKLLNDFANDCYRKYEICWIRQDLDSAMYWLNMRASKDSTNMNWQYDLAYNYYSIGKSYWNLSERIHSTFALYFFRHGAIKYYISALPILKKIDNCTEIIDDSIIMSVQTIMADIEPRINEYEEHRRRTARRLNELFMKADTVTAKYGIN